MDAPRVAIVTGAARGIGRAVANRLLTEAWNVLAVDQDGSALDELAAAFGDRCATETLDVTASGAPQRIVAATVRRFGQLDALVNNAGIGNSKRVDQTTDEEFDRFINVNLRSVFRLSREALGVMQSGSTIVHVASTFGLMGNPNASSYSATKAALIGLTRQMAVDYGPSGIRVNAVAPGVIDTPLTHERLADPAFRRLMVDTTPFPRIGRPEDIAAAVRFLCSPDAAFVNGHVLVIDGGWSATNRNG